VALAVLFGATGLALAAVGLYGVLSYMVARRRREIGIRMALGAGRREVRRLVLRDGLRLTGIGVVTGCAFAVVVTQVLQNLLFGINPLDPITYGTTVLLLGVVAWTACAMPVRRALATEPLEVLRHD
jgi:ABC-type antimicrobial peptide transport system permease subunit